MKGPAIGAVARTLGLIWAGYCALTGGGHSLSAQNQQVLRVTTRLVIANVVVHDRKGAPVADLTRDDFTILDGGKEEKIAVFSVNSRQAMQGPLEPLPANVFSNRVARQGGIPASVAVILVDGLGMDYVELAYARQQLTKFLSQLQPQDRVALYALGRQLRVIQDFTSDPSPLLEALRQYRGQVTGATDLTSRNEAPPTHSLGLPDRGAATATLFEAGLVDLLNSRSTGYQRLRGLDAIQAIANHLSGLPGRKSLIWLTVGLPLPQEFPPRIDLHHPESGGGNPLLEKKVRETILALNQADVAVYPVDARGLFTNPDFNAENEGRVHFEEGAHGRTLDFMNLQIQTMIYWAGGTGGRAFYNTNDLRGALRTALDDSEVTYSLGYYPTHGQWDGRYRPIKVRVNRESVEIHHRQGYFALADAPIEEKGRIALLKEAGQNPLDATGVGVTVRLRKFKSDAGDQLEIAVSVDPHNVTFQAANGKRTVLFDLWAGQYSNQGEPLGGISKTVAADLKEETYQKLMRERLNLTLNEKVERGAEELRVVVRDAHSGLVGSVKIPLSVSPAQ
jgi:VWFA-related protein